MKRALILLCLGSCTDAPRECGGETLAALQARIPPTSYEVIYVDGLPRTIRGTTIRLNDGPAIVYIANEQNRVSKDGALAHELGCHVARNVSHPPKPPQSNLAKPDRGQFWDRMKMGMPQ